MSLPQLRCRTEYSFKQAFGSARRVAERLAELQCPAAGIVDSGGTWGHTDWEKALLAKGIEPLFGAEIAVRKGDHSPRCWVLADDLPSLYRFTSAKPETEADLAAATGVVRFAGAALEAPESFDYIDINPRSRLQTRRALRLAEATGKPIVLTSDADYPGPEDRRLYLAWNDSRKVTPQHLLTVDELRDALCVPPQVFDRALATTHELAERLRGRRLQRAPVIQVEGDIRAAAEAGKTYRLARGHIAAWTAEYEARLQRELAMIAEKQYESYFLVVADLVCWAKERMLVGPARGSSAGSLVCYLLRITEIDPLPHNLLFERFIDVNRNDLPDIDIDFNDKKRDLVFEYAAQKYGRECVARIGNVNRLQARSALAHVGKKLGIPLGATFNVVNVLIEYSSGDSRYGKGLEDTLTTTGPGQEFVAKYPEGLLCAALEGHASHTGVHAAGLIVANVPVTDYCTVIDGIAQVDKVGAERLNLLKIDALGLRTLGVLEDAGCTAEQLYDLPLDDPEVFSIFNQHKFSGIFQFEGAAQRRVSIQIPINSFKQIDHVTALARPGPLGGGATHSYIQRNAGREEVQFRHPSMQAYLGDTLGVVLYQEQVMRISFEIGCMPWPVVSEIRKAMSGRKGKEYFDRRGSEFVEGAKSIGVPEQDANIIWDEICSFGAWGMNKSHTVSYAVISYWCAFMKRYHPLEYAAACLRNAKDDEQQIEILRELRDEGVTFEPFNIDLSQETWTVADGRLLGGFTNLVGIGDVKAAHYVHKRNNGGLDANDREKLAAAKVKHSDLRPAHTLWGHIYDDPDAHNIHGALREFAELQDGENAALICMLVRQERRDENETVRVAKRGGVRKTGQTLFLDAFVVDDSVSKPVILRLKPALWARLGEKMADRAIPSKDWFLVRGRWLHQFSMLSVEKIKCLTNPEMFE